MKPAYVSKILAVLIGAAVTTSAPALADSSGLKKFHMRSCSVNDSICLEVKSLKMDQSFMGGLWVSSQADVQLTNSSNTLHWRSKRVIIDTRQNMVIVEERTAKKLIEIVISLDDFQLHRQEMKL